MSSSVPGTTPPGAEGKTRLAPVLGQVAADGIPVSVDSLLPAEPHGRCHDVAAAARGTLLAGFSLDMAWKQAGELEPARAVIPPGTRVHVAFVDSEDLTMRVSAARAIRDAGFTPVPVIAARRLRSEGMLRAYLSALQAADASESVQVVAGDPATPRGPYPDAVSVIGSGLLEGHGVRQVSMAGHPGGHPAVADGVLWAALAGKAEALGRQGLGGSVVTQFGFDAARVLAWLAEARDRGISLPVRVGVPGPAAVRRLLAYASRCGVTVSALAAREYGFSLTEPAGTAGPDRFIRTLAAGYDPRRRGPVSRHFNVFGGFTATAEWISRFRGQQVA
jgi:methylenetetrahydrofolate reductase (NADPH)